MADENQVYFSHRQPKLVVRVAHKFYYGSTLYIIMRSAKFKTFYGTFYKHCYIATNNIPFGRSYIFAGLVGVRKVASADNRSIFYRACTKFVTRFASKINCSKTVKNRKNPFFF